MATRAPDGAQNDLIQIDYIDVAQKNIALDIASAQKVKLQF